MAPPPFSTSTILLCCCCLIGGAAAAAVTPAKRNALTESGHRLVVGAMLPHSLFNKRKLMGRLGSAIAEFTRSKTVNYTFPNFFSDVGYEMVMLPLKPTPKAILAALCDNFLSKNVTVILYMSKNEVYGRNTASSQYLLQLTGYLGIPVIWWNADNSGLMQEAGDAIVLQLAPSIEHQSAAMLSILKRYDWTQFSIVTTEISGFNDFIQTIRDQIHDKPQFRGFRELSTVSIECEELECVSQRLSELKQTDTRIILLYSTVDEARVIMEAAAGLDFTKKDFVWIVPQAIIGNIESAVPSSFPPGMLGVHFDVSWDTLLKQIDIAMKVFGHGLELFVNDPSSVNVSLVPQVSCTEDGPARWTQGQRLYGLLKNVSVVEGGPEGLHTEFNSDGTLKYAELDVMNLNEQQRWEKIGRWANEVLEIKDIVWPGNSHVPPPGVPEKFHLKVVFLEEPPFIKLTNPDPVTGKCIDRGVSCRVAKEADLVGSASSS